LIISNDRVEQILANPSIKVEASESELDELLNEVLESREEIVLLRDALSRVRMVDREDL
jgi:hypothetical protein